MGIPVIGPDGSSASELVPKGYVDGPHIAPALTQPGVLVVGTGKGQLPFLFNVIILSIVVRSRVAPTGASIIVDVNKNGTTIFTTQANRPSIAASGNVSSPSTPDVTAFSAGDYMTIDIDQVGSTVAGEDLVCVATYARA